MISKLWEKGVSITLARMDQFIYNLGLVLCASTIRCFLNISFVREEQRVSNGSAR